MDNHGSRPVGNNNSFTRGILVKAHRAQIAGDGPGYLKCLRAGGIIWAHIGWRTERSQPHAEWVSPQEAARWLMLMEIELPEDLKQYEEQVSE